MPRASPTAARLATPASGRVLRDARTSLHPPPCPPVSVSASARLPSDNLAGPPLLVRDYRSRAGLSMSVLEKSPPLNRRGTLPVRRHPVRDRGSLIRRLLAALAHRRRRRRGQSDRKVVLPPDAAGGRVERRDPGRVPDDPGVHAGVSGHDCRLPPVAIRVVLQLPQTVSNRSLLQPSALIARRRSTVVSPAGSRPSTSSAASRTIACSGSGR